MAELSTRYMGLELSSPVVVGACSLSGMIDNIKRAQDAGAGALVIKSLFEEQIAYEAQKLEDATATGQGVSPEVTTAMFPSIEHAGPDEHVMWVEKSRKEVTMPLIGSLNATQPGNWIEYATKLVEAGCDALELNTYAVQTDPDREAAEIEAQLCNTVEAVCQAVSVPVAVKLGAHFTNPVNVAKKVIDCGAKGVVLFNRFLQPDIDLENLKLRNAMSWSRSEEMRLPLRYIALTYGRIAGDIAASTGAHDAASVAKYILAGASIVQVASALYTNSIEYVNTLNDGLSDWMDAKGFKTLSDFRGKLSAEDVTDPFAFERAQYVELLLKQKH